MRDVGREIAELRAELEGIYAEEARRREKNPLAYFVPTGKQEEWIGLNGFMRIFVGANTSGKSCVGVNAVANLCLGPQSEWFERDWYKTFHLKKTRGRVVSTHTSIEENIIPEFKKWLPEDTWWATKSGKMHLSKWHVGKSYFDIMTFDQKIEEFESVTLDWVWFDEPPPERVLNATLARLRFGGIVFMTFTPLMISGYIYDRFIEPWEKTGNTASSGVVYSSMEDSCREHGVRGFMAHEDIARLKELYSLTGDEAEARIEGKFMHLSGRVYKLFEPEVHVVDPFEIPPHWPAIHTLDPHDRKEFACTWAAVSPKSEVYFYDEDFSCDLIETYVDMVLAREKSHSCITGRRLLDPNFGSTRSSRTGKIFRDEIEEAAHAKDRHMAFDLPSDDLISGHKSVNQALYYDKERAISDVNRPHLYIFSNCRNTINSMLKYVYKDYSPRREDTDGKSELVQQKHKDFADCVRYTMVSNPVYSMPKIVKRSIYAKGHAGR